MAVLVSALVALLYGWSLVRTVLAARPRRQVDDRRRRRGRGRRDGLPEAPGQNHDLVRRS